MKKKTTRKVTDKQKANLIPFKPGYDPKRNMKGRPKSFDKLRELFQFIAEDEIKVDGVTITRAEAIGLQMTTDKNLMKEFLEYAYGKVPLPQLIKVDEHSTITWKEFINGHGDSDSDTSNE